MGHASVKAYKGLGMEGFVARWYAATTLKDLKEHQVLARRVADELAAGAQVLEVAPGRDTSRSNWPSSAAMLPV